LEEFNGRLYQTVRGEDQGVYIRSTSDGNNWTGWQRDGGTLDAPELEEFNGRLYQTVRGEDQGIYIRSTSDGNNWTGWQRDGESLGTPTLTIFKNTLFQHVEGTDGKFYTRFLTNPTEAWSGWQESGEWRFGEGYYPDLSSLTDNDWDIESGDNTRFDGNLNNGESRDSIKQIYRDLSTAILGNHRAMNAGYLYDTSYRSVIGKSHSGIDMRASAGDSVKAATNGKVLWTDDWNASANGYFIAVEDTNGRVWVYGHLQNLGNWKKGDSVKVGDQIGAVGNQLGRNEHFHLAVGTKIGGGSVAAGTETNVRNATVSPLQAYWEWENRDSQQATISQSSVLTENIAKSASAPIDNVRTYLPHIITALREVGIYDRLTLIATVATIAVETGSFAPIREYGGANYFSRYDGRTDLGNTQPGDGAKYRGRGFIQLTGRANYRQYGAQLGVDLENNPDLALDPVISARILAAYFINRGIHTVARQENWEEVRKRVNGGLNGWNKFIGVVNKAKQFITD
ncbi:MAG: M23 family metallopeptidase, partial [Rivularia sp. (in: Bacteria)]|nr:M23 family metallopeptidase [Rivularia sp. MS3]